MNSEIGSMLIVGIFSLFLIYVAFRRGFFQLPSGEWPSFLKLRHLAIAFAIYFFSSFFLTQLALIFWKKRIMLHYMSYSIWLSFFVSSLIFLFLLLYLLSLPRETGKNILQKTGTPFSFSKDLKEAFYAWIVSFPLVLFLSQLLELLLMKALHLTQVPEQIAVKFLKSTLDTPSYFVLAVLSIVVLAPLVEETLFRGFLQSYIRKHLGAKQAIFITSFCFSLFHFSMSQGIANISIILPLFLLSLFLGLIYEKRGSLLSPIFLHAFFNTVSVLNLYLFGRFLGGL